MQFAGLIDLFRSFRNVERLIVSLSCEDVIAKHKCIGLISGLGKDTESLVWADIGVEWCVRNFMAKRELLLLELLVGLRYGLVDM